MKRLAAKQGDAITAMDTHDVIIPGSPPQKTSLAHPFTGIIRGSTLSKNVNIMGRPAATVDSVADNLPPHIPTPPGVSFVTPPTNQATIKEGSKTVFINRKAAARDGDPAHTCNDPDDPSDARGVVRATGTVWIG
jgi:uncharacterized Zn-binding protein involved in type VI secretion